MSLLKLDVGRCVHTSNKFAICSACSDACPVETVKINEGRISFTPSECVGCAGCLAACPTDAYALDDFNPINYVFAFLESGRDVLGCRHDDLPCIAGLSVEELVSIALLRDGTVTLDLGACGDCPIANINLPIIESRLEEVNFLLEAMMQSKRLAASTDLVEPVLEEKEAISRRALFTKTGLKKAVSIKQQFENSVEAGDTEERIHDVKASDIAKIKEKNIPQRRSLLMMALKRSKVPETFHIISAEDISFISQKNLDETTCTNCQMCYRICPTGALYSDNRGSFINFNPLSCVKCHSCHDVCEPDALTLKPTFALSSFFDPKIETMARFVMKRCDECGNYFAYNGGEVICPRCRIEEEEARALWGIE